MDLASRDLVQRIQSAVRLSEADMRRLAAEMCADGIRTAPEAEAVLYCHARLDRLGEDWPGLFIRALRDYLLLRTEPEGEVSADNLAWLRQHVAPDGRVRTLSELDLLIVLYRQAETVTEGYGLFVLECLCEWMISAGKAEGPIIERIGTVLAMGEKGGTPWVSHAEAVVLLRTNDSLGRAGDDTAWSRVFARAVGNYLMARAHPNPQGDRQALARKNWIGSADSRPGQYIGCLALGFNKGRWFEDVSQSPELARLARQMASEAANDQAVAQSQKRSWLRRRLGWEKTGEADRALVDFLNQEAPGLTTGLVVATG
ncbi:hypothetical protein [Hyphomonas pacifica]|nr:hypothetical protein [Hyphomonas pacifica]KCZ52111.1 hypothetical protein HY2_09720 [Hyphomonas pacifica]